MLNSFIRFLLENKLVAVLDLLLFVGRGISKATFNWESEVIPRDPVLVDAIPDIGENQQILFAQGMGRSLQDIGALIIFNQLGDNIPFTGDPEKIFHAVFHSVSAFNNAGFTLLPGGLTNSVVATNYSLHFSMAVLIVLGGIGFTVIWDVFDQAKAVVVRKARSPMRLDTRISLISASGLIVLDGILFYIFEANRTMATTSGGGDLTASLFQSVTARTAGFNTVEIATISTSTMVLLLVLMFIGASSGSTGGGIKTSTVAVLGIAIVNRVRRTASNGWASQINQKMVRKAGVILLCSLLIVITGTIALHFTEKGTAFGDLLFEEVSAFGTVGLSRGVTAELSTSGKSIIMGTMLVGREGPLTIAFAMIRDVRFYESTEAEGFRIG